MDRNTHNFSGDSEVMLSFFWVVQSFQFEFATHDVHTGQTFVINWSKIQLSWMLLYYPYKMMFSAYKSVIVSPCACDLFVSKVTKITRYMDVHFWRSFFGAISVCDDCILKSTTAWLPKLSVLYIHSFVQVHNTTFQIKTVFNNVLFSTKCITLACTLFGTKSLYIYIWPILKTWTRLIVSCLPPLKVNLRVCYASQFCFIVLYIQ